MLKDVEFYNINSAIILKEKSYLKSLFASGTFKKVLYYNLKTLNNVDIFYSIYMF